MLKSDRSLSVIRRPSSRDPSTPFEKESTLIGHRDGVTCLLQLGYGTGLIASGSSDNTIMIWDLAKGESH